MAGGFTSVLGNMTPEQINDAIARAREYADNKGVPMTLERLAATLGVERGTLWEYIKDYGDTHTPGVDALKRAAAECTASVMEHGMTRGNSPIMPIFYLKNNAGYRDKTEQETTHRVTFTGMDNLQD